MYMDNTYECDTHTHTGCENADRMFNPDRTGKIKTLPSEGKTWARKKTNPHPDRTGTSLILIS